MFAPRQKHDTRRTVLPTDSRTPTEECYSNPPRHQVRPHDSRLDSGSAVATISTHSAVTVLSRWIPGTAKFTAVGQHARGTGCIQVSTSALHASLANSQQVAAAQQLQPVATSWLWGRDATQPASICAVACNHSPRIYSLGGSLCCRCTSWMATALHLSAAQSQAAASSAAALVPAACPRRSLQWAALMADCSYGMLSISRRPCGMLRRMPP